jgi:hypothetical protein
MSTINLYESYKQKTRKFGVNDSSRFRESYVEAVNLVYAELNDQVFRNQTVGYIGSFDDVIDERLSSFLTMTFDATSNAAISDREFWAIEYDLERKSNTNGFTDTITDAPSDVVISILSNTFNIAGDTVIATAELPDVNVFKLKIESTKDGMKLYVDGDIIPLVFTGGDETTTQKIGTATPHVISGVTGYDLLHTRFLSAGTVIYDFLINEGTGTALADAVGGYIATLDGSAVWEDRYIEPSSGLDSQYRSPLDMGLDYHLQDGGEWAIEPESERERKWYTRGIPMARNILSNNTTYKGPLGIS